MLTQSPAHPSPAVSAAAAAASPGPGFRNFHYAPAPSPRQSPARAPAALSVSRRQSASFLSVPTPAPAPRPSPSLPQLKRYVAVDAGTQYSPMEPVDYATGATLPRVPSSSEIDADRATEPSSASVQQDPMALRDEKKPAPADQERPVTSASKRAGKLHTTMPAQPVSPVKRRNSQGPGSSGSNSEPSSTATSTKAALAKRSRPDDPPAKALPLRYEFCATEDMVVLIAHMLGELIETNDALALKSGHLTRFHSRTAPGISVLDYLHRLAKHATLTPPLLLSMVYYIDRLCALYPEFTINTLTVHRFLITAATVAAKGLSDAFWNNSTYARVGGVKVAELKLLELEFLYRVDWKIVPNPEVLEAYYRGLVERCPGYAMEEGQNDEDDDDDDDYAIDDEDDDDEEMEEEEGDDDESMTGQDSRSACITTPATSEALSVSKE